MTNTSVLHCAVVKNDVIGPVEELINEEEESPAIYGNFTYVEKFWGTTFATESCIDSFKASTT
ncbi:hypothetical protein ARALYDRAFT_910681 [Arabidopsis lyrata subsp. lyrata]|uniref:Uncharacterized protein n=1 Tax=Arabidopsis lyrata subsp. lyrata TaxID=81972 RepID=D7M4P2_ARALL|nr:hypothetical protein ARALYDRAFT_910681 [Arabidopsis lyrata subsp. lyrata]